MLDKLQQYNNLFFQNKALGNIENPDVFGFANYQTKICLTAPHATKTFVQKQIKSSDLYTGAICKYLSEELAVSSIIRNKFIEKKEMIIDFITNNQLEDLYFLDIHGMKQSRDFELAIGLGHMQESDYQTDITIAKELCDKYNISYTVNHPDYTGQPGLAGRLQKITNKSNVIQLEFRKDLRDFYNHSNIVQNKTIPFMLEFIKELKKNKLYHK